LIPLIEIDGFRVGVIALFFPDGATLDDSMPPLSEGFRFSSNDAPRCGTRLAAPEKRNGKGIADFRGI
jgi:hypothetical protein